MNSSESTSLKILPVGSFIIPAIDVMDGKCVRLSGGDFSKQKVYSSDPLDMAKKFEHEGLKRLHIVDLDGAKSGQMTNFSVLESIASATSLSIDFGGGVKKIDDVQNILNAGAAMVTIGSLAAKQPGVLEEWLMEFGAEKFFIGADVLHEKIKISGWLEDSGLNIFSFIGNVISLGTSNIFCTDISKDGMMKGPSIELYEKIIFQHPEINLVASGGVSNAQDVKNLRAIGCTGVIIGKAIYEELISFKELRLLNN